MNMFRTAALGTGFAVASSATAVAVIVHRFITLLPDECDDTRTGWVPAGRHERRRVAASARRRYILQDSAERDLAS